MSKDINLHKVQIMRNLLEVKCLTISRQTHTKFIKFARKDSTAHELVGSFIIAVRQQPPLGYREELCEYLEAQVDAAMDSLKTLANSFE